MIKKRLASRRRKQIVLLFLVCGIVMGVMGGRRYMEKDRQNDVNSGFVMVNYYEGGEWNMILYRDPEINRYKRDPSLKMYLHEYAIQRMMGNEWKKEDVLIGKYEGAMYWFPKCGFIGWTTSGEQCFLMKLDLNTTAENNVAQWAETIIKDLNAENVK